MFSIDFQEKLLVSTKMFIQLFVELAFLFLAISFLVALIQQKLPAEKIQKLLGGKQGRGYLTAAALGAVTPFCSCSTIPMLVGLLKAKAHFGAVMTFLFTSPLLNPIVIALFIPVLGWKVTLVYAVLALSTSLLAGVLLQRFKFSKHIRQELLQTSGNGSDESSCCDSTQANLASTACCGEEEKSASSSCCDASKDAPAETPCCGGTDKEPLKEERYCDESKIQTQTQCCGDEAELKPVEPACCASTNEATHKPESKTTSAEKTSACCDTKPAAETSAACCSDVPAETSSTSQTMNYALAAKESWSLFREMFPYMLIAMLIGAWVHGFVPASFLEQAAGPDNPFAIPTAAVVGVPLYIRVTALLPLVAPLAAKGVSIGAIMALVIGAGGASLPEMIMLKRLFRWPLLTAFVSVILVMAVVGGYTFNALFIQ